jgi:anti-sigma factor RsiW
MNHEQTIDKLGAWLDGELPADRAEAMRRHVAECSACASRVDEMKRLDSALDALPSCEAPAGFAERVRAAAERRTRPARVALFDRVQAAHPVVMRMAAGLVVLAGLVVGVLAGTAAPEPARRPSEPAVDPAVDALSAAPEGSLADAALAFYTEPAGGDQR